MEKEMQKKLKVGSKIGALAGGILFIIFGIVPAFYIGSYGTLALLSHLMGGPVDPGLITRGIVVVGILLALFCAAASSIVVGSLAGTTLAFVAEAVTSAFRAKPKTAAESISKE